MTRSATNRIHSQAAREISRGRFMFRNSAREAAATSGALAMRSNPDKLRRIISWGARTESGLKAEVKKGKSYGEK